MNGALQARLDRYAPPLFTAAAGILGGAAIARVGWLLAALFAVLSFVLVWPVQTSLGMLAATVPFDDVSALSATGRGLTLTFLIGVGCMVVLACLGLMAHRLSLPGPEVVRLLAFLVWAACSVWWAHDPSASLARMPTMASLYLLYVIVSCLKITDGEFQAVGRFTIAGGFAAALLAISGSSGSDRASLTILNRATDPNVFAASLLLPLSLALGEVISARKRLHSIFAAGISAAILFAIFTTISRGALVAVVVMIAVYVRRLRWKWPVAAGLIVAYCSLFVLPHTFTSRIQEATTTGGAGRLYIWQAGLNAFEHYSLQGAGLENFEVVYQYFAGAGKRFTGIHRDAHNIYLQVAVELGAVGLALFLWALHGQFKRFRQVYRASQGLLQTRLIACEAAFWSMLAAAFFLNLLWKKPLWLCFILLALATKLGARRIAWQFKAAARLDQPAQPQTHAAQLQGTGTKLEHVHC